MGRFGRSIQLLKASWEVLKADKELMMLPVISAIASMIVGATFILPIALTSGFNGEPGPVQYVIGFVFYLVLSFITIFFNAALVHAANDRLEGRDPTLKTAILGAASRIGAIFSWALVAATVSVILKAIEERVGFVGRLITGFLGLAWTLVTFLILPILVIEGIGVKDAFTKSAEMFKRTWGENMVGQIGLGLVGFVALLPALLLVVAGFAVGGPMIVVGIAVFVLWSVLVAVVMTALNGIFQTALYRYASGKQVGAGFDNELLASAFQPRR